VSRLRLLLMWAGDWVYGLLVSFGWQPSEQQEGDGQPPSSM
jgi:hypothetical protein